MGYHFEADTDPLLNNSCTRWSDVWIISERKSGCSTAGMANIVRVRYICVCVAAFRYWCITMSMQKPSCDTYQTFLVPPKVFLVAKWNWVCVNSQLCFFFHLHPT